ncbi:MAG: coproporphyrinogen III oxidase, partial [Pseudomonadota bacterium]
SSISQFSQGYVQNATATAAYIERIEADMLAGHRGYALTDDDRLRADAINMLMCDFEIDLDALTHHENSETLVETHAAILQEFQGYVIQDWDKIRITEPGRPLSRMIAQRYDRFSDIAAQYSQAS